MQTHGKPARWMDFSLKTADGKEAGIAILDHPKNPRHPSPWYLAKKGHFGYFSPAILFKEKMELKKGQKLSLKYRTLIHPGRTDREMLDNEYKIYVEGM